jgi:hypothetical protein
MTLFTKSQTQQLIANCQAQIVRMDNAGTTSDRLPPNCSDNARLIAR